MNQNEMADMMEAVFHECQKLRGAGQKEYAHEGKDAFSNFNRVAERTGLDRKQVLLVYAEKHIDGIHTYVQGHASQREDVRGRINDLIVYMCLLRGMIEEEEQTGSLSQVDPDVEFANSVAASLRDRMDREIMDPDHQGMTDRYGTRS